MLSIASLKKKDKNNRKGGSRKELKKKKESRAHRETRSKRPVKKKATRLHRWKVRKEFITESGTIRLRLPSILLSFPHFPFLFFVCFVVAFRIQNDVYSLPFLSRRQHKTKLTSISLVAAIPLFLFSHSFLLLSHFRLHLQELSKKMRKRKWKNNIYVKVGLNERSIPC